MMLPSDLLSDLLFISARSYSDLARCPRAAELEHHGVELIELGLVERRGDRLHITSAGVDVVHAQGKASCPADCVSGCALCDGSGSVYDERSAA